MGEQALSDARARPDALADQLAEVWCATERWRAVAAHVRALMQAERDRCPGCGHEPDGWPPQGVDRG